MTAERCAWREWLGAQALGQLEGERRAALEAHLEGCAACRAELASLRAVARLLPLADPERLGGATEPPPELAERVVAAVGAERGARRRLGRLRLGLAGATAVVAAALLALALLPGSGGPPRRHVAFSSPPAPLKIGATLVPRPFGTEIHVYVKGARSGALCRVFLRDAEGARMPAGSFRYRWGADSGAVLGAGLDLAETAAIGVRVGERTFEAPVNPPA